MLTFRSARKLPGKVIINGKRGCWFNPVTVQLMPNWQIVLATVRQLHQQQRAIASVVPVAIAGSGWQHSHEHQ